jgi:hypothetical protein
MNSNRTITSVYNPSAQLAAKLQHPVPSNILHPPAKLEHFKKSKNLITTEQQAQDALKQIELQRKSALTDKEYRFGSSEGIMQVLHLDERIKTLKAAFKHLR